MDPEQRPALKPFERTEEFVGRARSIFAAVDPELGAQFGVMADEELLDLVSGRIRAVPGVRSTETFMYLKLAKQTYSWGVR